jgi:hypothetical protein
MESISSPRILSLLVLIVVWLLCAWGTALAAANRGADFARWFALGLLAGPFAWMSARQTGKICPHCRSKIHLKAKRCPHCQLPQTYKDLTTELRPHPEGLVARSGKDGEI